MSRLSHSEKFRVSALYFPFHCCWSQIDRSFHILLASLKSWFSIIAFEPKIETISCGRFGMVWVGLFFTKKEELRQWWTLDFHVTTWHVPQPSRGISANNTARCRTYRRSWLESPSCDWAPDGQLVPDLGWCDASDRMCKFSRTGGGGLWNFHRIWITETFRNTVPCKSWWSFRRWYWSWVCVYSQFRISVHQPPLEEVSIHSEHCSVRGLSCSGESRQSQFVQRVQGCCCKVAHAQ